LLARWYSDFSHRQTKHGEMGWLVL
jgi:hypothetical protein